MTFFGLVAAYLAGKLLDALVSTAQNSPAAPGRVSPPPRHPASSRRSTPHIRAVPRYDDGPPPFKPVDYGTPKLQTPAWPSAAPTRPAASSSPGAFPGPDWIPDNPVPAAVVARAQELLPELWAEGLGAFRIEQTGGRQIAYQAAQMGEKHGVVAYRLRASQPASSSPAAARSSSSSSAATMPASTSSTALPVLRRGSKGAEVKILQTHLGIASDGSFGPGTENAVRAFQRSRGLTPDGVVGAQTWGALLGQQAA